MPETRNFREKLAARLGQIYPTVSAETVTAIETLVDSFGRDRAGKDLTPADPSALDPLGKRLNRGPSSNGKWDQRDVVLITYGDQISSDNESTLVTLRKFLHEWKVTEVINIVHLLPFYPYSSDDGFSVIDYCDLAPGMGTWADVRDLAKDTDLMFDLVLNHCSQENEWFKKFLLQEQPYDEFFHVVDPKLDLSAVTRPRSLPLLTRFETSDGEKHVWTTFSADQVDLNFSQPLVLIEFLKILLFYVQQGARIIRLDAIAFLWKEIGTPCVHLNPTHQVVKLMHDVLAEVAPEVVLLTETNVPHKENVSYFGSGDEADMVYQFSLPPLLLDAFIHEDPSPLRNWLLGLDTIPSGTTFFNFTASHDGIGVRPLEGLLEPDRFQSLVAAMRERGAYVGMRQQPDGSQTPYELNITYLDAISSPRGQGQTASERSELDITRFISSQAVMLSLPGIPGVYFHSLVGTPNDLAGAKESGIPRRINRRKYEAAELDQLLSADDKPQAKIFQRYQNLLRVRTGNAAFHPDGDCEVMMLENAQLFGVRRISPDGSVAVIAVTNPTSNHQALSLERDKRYLNLMTGDIFENTDKLNLPPLEFRWLQPME